MATAQKHSDFDPYFPTIVPKDGLGYDPERDIRAVDPVGFIDLHKAFVEGVIPGDFSVNVESYNGVDEPGALVGRPSDVFDAIRKASAVRSAEAAQGSVGQSSGSDGE